MVVKLEDIFQGCLLQEAPLPWEVDLPSVTGERERRIK
jgi:hypothetical protein